MPRKPNQLQIELIDPANGDVSRREKVSTAPPEARTTHDLALSRLLTVKDVAALCQISEKTVRRAIERGDLAETRPGNSVRIRPDDLDDWLNHARDPHAPTRRRRRAEPPRPDGLRALLDD